MGFGQKIAPFIFGRESSRSSQTHEEVKESQEDTKQKVDAEASLDSGHDVNSVHSETHESSEEEDTPKHERGSILEYVHLEHLIDRNGNWIVKRAEEKLADGDDEFAQYSFTVLKDWEWDHKSYTVYVEVKNDALKDALQSAMGEIDGLSWNESPFRIEPQLLLTFHAELTAYLEKLEKTSDSSEDSDKDQVTAHFRLLMTYLNTEHKHTLANIKSLVSHKEITFDLAWAVLVPRTTLFLKCPISGLPRAAKLVSRSIERDGRGRRYWDVYCDYTDSSGGDKGKPSQFGLARVNMEIPSFKGTIKITSLPTYPLQYHPQEQSITQHLIERGRRWASLDGRFHKRYDDVGYFYKSCNGQWLKVTVASRIMIDKETYRSINPNNPTPDIQVFSDNESHDEDLEFEATETEATKPEELTDDQLLLATPLLYGFSLSDKIWLAFKVDSVTEIQWQEDAFNNLVLPAAQKSLIQALVQSHKGPGEEGSFDDFIQGKGRGLIINLFGPPGVGKTLSAESTSEYVRKPLYVVGVGEIARNVEQNLKEIFDIASIWKAIVLIDEADVFMEQRSVHDLERNALVAVFLRQLEYYQGILFLTTNRVKVFDEAFQSRIHISLHYSDLTPDAKKQIWKAFFEKAGMVLESISESEWQELSTAKVNGRQIKNAVRSCQGLAQSRNEQMAIKHVKEVLGVMEQFEKDLKSAEGSNA